MTHSKTQIIVDKCREEGIEIVNLTPGQAEVISPLPDVPDRMDADQFENHLQEIFRTYERHLKEETGMWPDMRFHSFEDEGLLTNNRGVVIRVGNSEFQLTIVQSR